LPNLFNSMPPSQLKGKVDVFYNDHGTFDPIDQGLAVVPNKHIEQNASKCRAGRTSTWWKKLYG
jgi:hypothetical protein